MAKTAQATRKTVAAVDLGSNSFHMVVATADDGHVAIVDRLRERVQLAANLTGRGNIGKPSRERAVACLERFGQRLRDVPAEQVRAVGTNALRAAKNRKQVLEELEAALGAPIEVISGVEEARLIYRGVTGTLRIEEQQRLVVDIGGGSTEIILGVGDEIHLAESLHMGCVSFSQRFFPEGVITEAALKDAEIHAALELRPLRYRYRDHGWEVCFGSSGTISAVAEMLRAADPSADAITPKGLARLRRALLAAGRAEALALPGLKDERKAVLPGGFAVLAATFDSLKIKRMFAAEGALREGLLYDLLGRDGALDERERSVRALGQRLGVDWEQAQRVEDVAVRMLGQVARDWALTGERPRKFLRWAALLHEIGLSVSHSRYHRHGAYLVANADMPGFSKQEQALLASLIRMHRRRPRPEDLEDLRGRDAKLARKLGALLRLSVRLKRNRSNRPEVRFDLSGEKGGLRLLLPEGWLADHPLTRADLEEEAVHLAALGLELRVGETADLARG